MFRHTPFRIATLLALLVGMVIASFFAGYFGLEIMSEIIVLAILVLALDLVAGFGGMVSLCHGALLGFGAYAFAVFTALLGWDPSVAMIAAIAATGAVGWIIGALCSGSHGIYFIMVTLAFGQMAYSFVFGAAFLGGDDGMSGITRPDLSAIGVDLNDSRSFVLYALVCAVIAYLFAAQFLRSGLGRSLVGVQQSEQRVRALGLVPWRTKAHAFGVSGLIAGLAGVLAAQHIMYISPGLLSWTVSGEALVVVILGGLGTLVGPLVGAVAFVLIKHEVAAVTPYWHLVVGVILIAVVMSRANGIFGFVEVRLNRRRAAKVAATDVKTDAKLGKTEGQVRDA
jgi:branched-chain amino acid transport system permease protein